MKTLKVIRGIGASSGVARGKARVVFSPDEIKEENDFILVTEMTSPVWTPVIARVKAIVTNSGGMLSHAAIVAREFGIPAVVGTGSATNEIKDGELIEVDGSKGVVYVLAPDTE